MDSTISESETSTAATDEAMETFEALYRERWRSIYHFFIAKGFSRDDCLELVQETFCEAFRSRNRFEGKAQLGTWLTAIAKNLWRNRVRHERRQKRSGDEIALDGLEAHQREAMTRDWSQKMATRSGIERLLDNERHAFVQGEIDKLPARMRQCLRMRIDGGLQYKEIASALGISESTAKTNVRDARLRLETRCGERFPS